MCLVAGVTWRECKIYVQMEASCVGDPVIICLFLLRASLPTVFSLLLPLEERTTLVCHVPVSIFF